MDQSEEYLRVGVVVELCNQIELYMKAIIEDYVEPRQDRATFFRAYVLNNAIVSFSSKMKLVFEINRDLQLVKLDRDAFHKVMNLRNAFAHNDLISGIRVEEPMGGNESIMKTVVLESIRGDGLMDTISRGAAFQEFRMAHQNVESSLKLMLGKLRGG